jgi:pyruvate kinase
MNGRFGRDRVRRLLAEIEQVIRMAQAGVAAWQRQVAAVPAERRASAINLAHYLAVRSRDLRQLQRDLASCSLSSLGRMEASVMDTLSGVREVLAALSGSEAPAAGQALDMAEAEQLLDAHTMELLGPRRAGRSVRIMVTLPLEAARDQELLRQLMSAGMDVARVNLAHGGSDEWTAMVDNLRAASADSGVPCRVMVDLPGPKLRTGALRPGPQVCKVRPGRDVFGVVTQRAAVAFVDPQVAGHEAAGTVHVLPVVEPIAALAEPGDELILVDTRGRVRRFSVLAGADGVVHTALDRTTYVAAGARLELQRGGELVATTRIGALPARENAILLEVGDRLQVTRDQTPGGPLEDAAQTGIGARVPCTLPEVFAGVRAGQRVLFDDGRITGVVEASGEHDMLVRITEVPPGGGKLKAEKGINLPDSRLDIGALTEFDRSCLDWVAEHADLVGMSFVQRPQDVLDLHEEMAKRGRADLGVVLKIETRQAFERLPELLFAGLQSPPLGVMVARGDLAVEVGYARLAEVQEEILWLCEAAHLPVIWATQVLDSMARTGVPSRAEVSDAGMAVQAECVMLNKGPHIVPTTAFLAGVLERMSDHHRKKRAMLRRLRVAGEVRIEEEQAGG